MEHRGFGVIDGNNKPLGIWPHPTFQSAVKTARRYAEANPSATGIRITTIYSSENHEIPAKEAIPNVDDRC